MSNCYFDRPVLCFSGVITVFQILPPISSTTFLLLLLYDGGELFFNTVHFPLHFGIGLRYGYKIHAEQFFYADEPIRFVSKLLAISWPFESFDGVSQIKNSSHRLLGTRIGYETRKHANACISFLQYPCILLIQFSPSLESGRASIKQWPRTTLFTDHLIKIV